MLRLCVFFSVFILLSCSVYGQVDTEFWFAPPEVTVGHGDRPLYLRISTLNQSAVVSVLQPGRNNIQLATASVPANTTHTIDLTSHITDIETISPAKVLNTGIRIISSAPVSAYYEVGAPWNSDIFALKGRNALGNKFVIPGQNFYHNSGQYAPLATSSFDIVATQNNTVVKVRPTKPIVGHLTDTLILVKLNAGQTYSFQKPSLSAADNAVGTIVESNKPIAITIKDDSVINNGCRDILGDQLVPVEVAGSEYVVLKGFLETEEYLFITATEDDTEIFVGAGPSPTTVLSAGELYRHPITQKSTYILSNKTIYVFHVTGFGCEMGLAILPSINCKGSPQIGFARTTNEFFGLNVLVRKEGIGSFVLNGSASMIPASSFTPVPGTDDQWYAAQLSFDTGQIPVGRASLISNHLNSFQVGIINGNAATTCRYGYFSSFSTLFIGDDLDFCAGEAATLDAGPGKESYLWSTGETSQKIDVSSAGEYWVKVEREDCILYDTIKVDVKTGHLDLGPDVAVCRGDTAKIDGKENFSWQWSDGNTSQFLETTSEGKYWASVRDYTGCIASDTIVVSLKELPAADLGPDILKCKHDPVFVDASFPGATYAWHDGITTASRDIMVAGLYSVSVTWSGCTVTDSISVQNLPGPLQDSIYGSPSVCPYATGIRYSVENIPNSAYQWFVRGGSLSSSNGHEISVDWLDSNTSAVVKALIRDGAGCLGDTLYYPVRINVVLLPEIPIGPDTLCLNKSLQVAYSTPVTNGSVYHWNISGGEIAGGQGTNEALVNWSEGLNRLWINETSVTADTVCEGTSADLYVYVFKDDTELKLNFVSVDTALFNVVNVDWTLTQLNPVQADGLTLHKRTQSAMEWQSLMLPPFSGSLPDDVDFSVEGIHEYYLSATNYCEEFLSTAIHNNMFLTGSADTTSGQIELRWNHYFGWSQGVDRYELWRKADSEPGFRYLATISPLESSFSGNLATDAFQHAYVVRALEKDGGHDSWSSIVSFAFKHSVTIPNVITPNGDDYNQYFHISKVELYTESELTIMDRWGKVVLHVVNYRNDWDGGGLSSGVYYYILDLKRGNRVYKGSLTIL